MGKRTTKFERKPRDYYPTIDPRATAALVPFLAPGTRYVEPCAGAGHLIKLLDGLGHRCVFASDIEPQAAGVKKADATRLDYAGLPVITNPPWSRPILHKMIETVTLTASEAWFLFDADWAHNAGSAKYDGLLTDIVSVGRLTWEEGTGIDGVDNIAWYRFARDKFGATRFWMRSRGKD